MSLSAHGIVFIASTIDVSVTAAPYSPPYPFYAAAAIVITAIVILVILVITHRYPFKRQPKPK